MRPSADGAENMAPTMPGAFAESHLPAVMSGTSTRLQFGSMADAGYGGLSTKTDMCSTKSCRFAANTKAARRLLIRLLKKQSRPPKRIITDKLRSYGAAKRQVMPDVEHRSHKGLNNRAENSHLSFRKRERMLQGFRSIGSLSIFFRCSPPSAISSFQITQNLLPAKFAITDGPVEGRQRPDRLKLQASALTRQSFKQGDNTPRTPLTRFAACST